MYDNITYFTLDGARLTTLPAGDTLCMEQDYANPELALSWLVSRLLVHIGPVRVQIKIPGRPLASDFAKRAALERRIKREQR